jgi:hypothetical protein
MSIVSIDVGIRNLSFCFFDPSHNIVKWDNLDLTEQNTSSCDVKGCGKQVKYTKGECSWCLKHSKLQPFIVMPKELTKSMLNKTKVAELKILMNKYGLSCDSLTRPEIMNKLITYAENTCFESKNRVSAVHLNLVIIGRNIQHKLNAIFDQETISTVIIENQIGPLATKMKTVQGMLAQYFIMKNNDIQIEFISAANKLKGLTDETELDYKGRKKMGIQCCGSKIEGTKWETFFKSHKKKDDLADCYLQGLWYIRSKL